MQRLLVPLAALLTACLTRPVPDASPETTTTDGTDSTAPPTTTITPTTASPEPDTATAADSTDTGTGTDTAAGDTTETGGPFLEEGEPCILDDWHEPPCGPGLKCMPFADDGSQSWSAAACFPIDPDPVGLYEPCVWFGGTWSGFDNCGEHAYCHDPNGDGMGECKGLCIFTGPTEDATCEDAASYPGWGCQSCFCDCEVLCHPFDAGGCDDDEVCAPVNHPGFSCFPDASGDMGAYGDECNTINGCDSGLFCANPVIVAACAGQPGVGCCGSLCDLDQPNLCPGEGELCQPWFERWEELPGFENVGYCGLPL